MIKVCKFGGTSMACGTTFRRVKEILSSDPARRYAVVSAPGKRYGGEVKMTDLLYAAHACLKKTGSCGAPFEKIKTRIRGVSDELGLKTSLDVDALLNETEEAIVGEKSEAFTVSRGEYLSARLMAAYWGAEFFDAKDLVVFGEDGKFDGETSYRRIAAALKEADRAVIPGFYGADRAGRIVCFPRGGSDISGAVVARAIHADLYENWTDVSGFLVCDPRISENPAQIKELTYRELRALSYMGAGVLHVETLFPVRGAGIPICIRNTFRPEDPGTTVVERREKGENAVTGISGKKGFTAICVEKTLLSGKIGAVRRILGILEENKISFEHLPSGIDTILLVMESARLQGGILENILGRIEAEIAPDRVSVFSELALVAVVGQDMRESLGVWARIFKAVAQTGVKVRLIDQGSLGQDIIFGVDEGDLERTVRAVYDEFFHEE